MTAPKLTQSRVAATIAYSMDDLTLPQRMIVANAFATDWRLTGERRSKFIEACHKASEARGGTLAFDGEIAGQVAR